MGPGLEVLVRLGKIIRVHSQKEECLIHSLDLSKSSTFRHSADSYSFILLCIFLKDSEVFIYDCVSVPYGTAAHGGLKKVSQALGLELPVVVSGMMWVLGTALGLL